MSYFLKNNKQYNTKKKLEVIKVKLIFYKKKIISVLTKTARANEGKNFNVTKVFHD